MNHWHEKLIQNKTSLETMENHLFNHPELGFKEKETRRILLEFLNENHIEIDQKLVGKLGHIKRLTVLSTSEVLTDFMRNDVGNPIETSLMNMTLAICGIVTDTLWLNCERIVSGTDQDRELYIKRVIERIHR